MIAEEVERTRQAATEMLQSLPPDATEARKDIATAALQSLPPGTAAAVQVR